MIGKRRKLLVTSATVALTACGSPANASHPSPAQAPTTTQQCIGLSICPQPAPDAQGNPACYYADGWRDTGSGAGIEVWYFRDPQNPPKAGKVTAIVRRKDGTTRSQDADIDANQQVHRFEFADVDPHSVEEVLLTTGTSSCFVIGADTHS